MKDEPSWKLFERAVAAIYKEVDPDADVRWNEKIGNDQFDATIRFKKGLESYLTVVECRKRETRNIEGSAVDAFITKARRANANQAVMVARKGFQTKAIDAARDNGIVLRTLTEVARLHDSVSEVVPAIHLFNVKLLDGSQEVMHAFSDTETDSDGNHRIAKVIITDGDRTMSLGQYLQAKVQEHFHGRVTAEPQQVMVATPAASWVEVPDQEAIQARWVALDMQLADARLPTTKGFDQSLLRRTFVMRDAINGDEQSFGLLGLRLGFGTVFRPGGFYRNPVLRLDYFCEAVDGDKATMCLLDSVQHGRRFSVSGIVMSVDYANAYVEIRSASEIERLTAAYEQIGGRYFDQRG